ncbi:MAG: UDPGP type 1 family protein [Planctomycetota bacterium]|nr:UDPGP type 1 family protein [Planctomycetota bacterium]
MHERLDALRETLEAHGQAHVLRFAEELDEEQSSQLASQLESLDFARLSALIKTALKGPDDATSEDVGADSLQPPRVLDWGIDEDRDTLARQAGAELLSAGKVGAFLVAGGQGTRLGYDGPKGRFPVGPLTNRTLFAFHAQRVLATSRRYGAKLPFYIMTSRVNHEDTRNAFEEAHWFGLDPAQVFFLQQGMLPAITSDGKLLLSTRSSLSLSPDGHGGCFRALRESGALEDMESRGLEQLFYFQVDNPLAQVLDPLFVGHHAMERAEMSTKVVDKTDPAEKVGVLALREGKTCLLEYSDLPDQLAEARDADGRLRFRAGNIAIHMLTVDFLRQIATRDELPVHRASKKVPCLDEKGDRVVPDEPNAVKMEMFVFDALPLAQRSVTQVVLREDEFSPVKNAEGSDSPATCTAALSEQAKRWMASAGLAVPDGVAEIGPLFALDQEEFRANLTRGDFGPMFDRPA